ncbi:hypothetical protein [Sphingobacterium siyangense]|uniref:hypothetical protein n=1 Tax=Sphingobacterium siyangense TaxID=459529 RepID=UPI003019E54F
MSSKEKRDQMLSMIADWQQSGIVPLPDLYKDQENFWIWFHPCFQTSQDVADLNDLYKYLDDEWFDDDVMETDDRYYG